MTSPSDKVSLIDEVNEIDDNGINFQQILSFLSRNKKSILSVTTLLTIISNLAFFTQKKIWQGEFQIVLENTDSNRTNSQSLSEEARTAEKWLGSKSSEFLDTEVGKLESSSVLMPIFEFVKNQKSKTDRKYEELKFKDWKKKHLNIGLVKGTFIVDVVYKDSDKELILPVLNKISSGYQSYSTKKRLRNIELNKNFYNDQIEIYKKKSLESYKNAQNFAIENNLTIAKRNLPAFSSFEPSKTLGLENFTMKGGYSTNVDGQINIEVIRIRNEEIIRNIKVILEEIEDMGDNLTNIVAVAKSAGLDSTSFGGGKNIGLEIVELDKKIALKKINFRDTDDAIINLQKYRRSLALLLKNKTINFLNGKLNNAQINLKSAIRPKGVLTKYRQLLNEARRDEILLTNLESNFRQVLFQDSRTTDPWELITKPNIFNKPVYPKLGIFNLFGLFGGFFIGCYIINLMEQKKKIIYSSSGIKNKPQDNKTFDYEIPIFDKESIKEILQTNLGSSLVKKGEKIALVLVGENISNICKDFKSIVKTISIKEKVNVINQSEIDETYQKSVLVVNLGMTNEFQVSEVRWKLKLNEIENIGYLSFKGIQSTNNNIDIIKEIIIIIRNLFQKGNFYVTQLTSVDNLKNFNKRIIYYISFFKDDSSKKNNENSKS